MKIVLLFICVNHHKERSIQDAQAYIFMTIDCWSLIVLLLTFKMYTM